MLFVNIYIVEKFQKNIRRSSNVNMWLWNYVKCLQNQYDNRHNFSVKLRSMFDLHVDSTSKLHRISAKAKLDLA